MDFKLPQLGEGIYEAELVRWLVQPGTVVKRGQGLMEVMTDKATMEVPAAFAGTIATLHAEPGSTVKVGELILTYESAGSPSSAETVAAAASTARESVPSIREPLRARSTNGHHAVLPPASPSVRHLARKLGVDLSSIHGSGPGGRILLEDVARAVRPAEATSRPAPTVPQLDVGKAGTRVKMAGLRRKIAEHMVAAVHTIPHFTYVDECEVTDMVRLRQMLREPLAKHGVKLTYLAFIVKAAVEALKEVPIVNASLDDTAGEIIVHDRYHIGVATATPAGLVVPVIRDADRKDLWEVARDIERFSHEARAGKLRREDLRGSTFTVTSIGGMGGLLATPIINHPEVAILGVGKVVKRPVYDEHGRIRPADILFLSLAFDHRVIDGAVGVAFGNALIRVLTTPATLLLPDRYR